jgi:hypothetical protein
MVANELMVDAFERLNAVVHEVVEGLSKEDLAFRPDGSANSIAWLVWHLARIQDDHIADLAQTKQVWSDGWSKRLGLPFEESDTGYGHSSKEVMEVKVEANLLLGYHEAVISQTTKYLGGLTDADYHRVVDKNWDPPVTLAARLISVIADDLQHVGQAAYAKGLLK